MNKLYRRPLPHMTTDEFLAWPGDGSGRRFQLVDGEIRPMSPASRIHAVIQANIAFLVIRSVRGAGLPLQVGTEAAIVPRLQADNNVRVPDLVVGPRDDQRGDLVIDAPVVLVEVLSPSNTDDTRDNVRAYATLPSVLEIAVVHSSRIEAELHRRAPGAPWPAQPEIVQAGGRLLLSAIGLDCALDEAYADTWLTR